MVDGWGDNLYFFANCHQPDSATCLENNGYWMDVKTGYIFDKWVQTTSVRGNQHPQRLRPNTAVLLSLD